MGGIEKKDGFVKQISIYLAQGEKKGALALAKEFSEKFPDESIASLLLAQSAFESGAFPQARDAGRKGFNLAKSPDDMLSCAILSAMACFELKEYQKGYELLTLMEKSKKSAQLEALLLLFALSLDDPKKAADHMQELYLLDQSAASDMLISIAKGLAKGTVK